MTQVTRAEVTGSRRMDLSGPPAGIGSRASSRRSDDKDVQLARAGAGGYDFDGDNTVVGGQLSLPLNRVLELYPSVDVYFVDVGSRVGFNGDLKVRLNRGAAVQLCVAGGVNVLRISSGGASNTDTGWDLLGGLESRFGHTHPYVEGRAMQHDGSAFQLNAGLNITLF